MCVLYVSFGCKIIPRTFGCVARCSTVLFILWSRYIVYSTGSRVESGASCLSGFSVKLFCPGKNFM